MPGKITRSYLQRTHWIATLTTLCVLSVTVVVGGFQLQALKNNARYSAAFVDLTQAANEVENTLLRLILTEDQAVGPETWVDALAQVHDATMTLARVYTALHLSEPAAGDTHSDAQAHDHMTDVILLDRSALRMQFGLAERGMPSDLVTLWESRDDEGHKDGAGHEADHRTDHDAALSTGEAQRLEERIGTFITLALEIEAQVKAGALPGTDLIRHASDHFQHKIDPAFGALTVAIRKSADEDAQTALAVIALGAALCALVALANAAFLFRPMVVAVAQTQAELIAERDRALVSAQAKKDFLAVMSHELRTPMNGVLGFAALTLRTELSQAQRDYVETIKSSGESLLELLNAILDLSKIEAGSLEPEPHRFSLHETVDSAVQLMAAQAFEKRLDVTHFIDPNLPSEMIGDSSLIRKLVLNLVGNAIKFTEVGGVAIEVRGAPSESPDAPDADAGLMVEISVSDTGIGIPESKLSLIFDRFAQADASTRRVHQGTGLGLSICREISELLGGRIWVESTPGSGSKFRALLRLDHADPAAPSLREANGQDLSRVRVLVVDDIPLNCRIATLQLVSYGARISTARSAVAALEALVTAIVDGDPYDICVIDQMMPVTDGPGLLRMIRTDERYGGLKTILSSSAGIRTDADARELGFDAAVPKPVNQDRLVSSIAALLTSADHAAGESRLDAQFEDAERASGPARPTHPAPTLEPAKDAATDAGPHILIVEDNAANLKLAALILAAAGYTHDTAVDGVEAVSAATRFRYAAILMDIRMPIMDGIEATRRIRQLPGARGATPIIAMTADIADYSEQDLRDLGMAGVIIKPIDDTKLTSMLADLTGPGTASTAA